MSTVPFDRNSSQQPGFGGLESAPYPLGVPRHLDYPNMPAWSLLDRASKSVPQRIAAEFLGTSMTYAQVNDASLRFANWLQQQGVGDGERVGVLLPNCPEYLIALNAIWRAGGVAVAISPLSVPEEVSDLLQLVDCRTVVTLDMLSGLLSDIELYHTCLVSLSSYMPVWKRAGYLAAVWRRTGQVRFPTSHSTHWLWDVIGHSAPDLSPVETVPASDPAYILSTGGTTCNPKAVTLSHRNIVANAWQQMHWAGASMGEEVMLAILPFFHSYGMSTMLASGCALGATLIMKPRFQARPALAAIEQQRPTVFHAVPAMLDAMNQQLRKRTYDLSSLKWVISGGASLPKHIAEEFVAHSGAVVVEGYGLSEASPVTHVGPLDGSNVQGTIGLPLPDTDCRIVDIERGQRDVGEGEVGELIVRGPQIMLGYWKNRSATDAVLRDGWLFTGDLAERTPHGFYRIVDRKKDLIITSGFNVYPTDVEQVLRGCALVRDVAVVGVPDSHCGELVKAFVVLKPGCKWNHGELNSFCQQHLAAHRRPQLWEHVEGDLPRNFLGKVVRRQLRPQEFTEGVTL